MAFYDQQQFGRGQSVGGGRRPSFSGPAQNFPPYNDQYRGNNNQYNEFSNGGGAFPEVSGPPPGPPPHSAPGPNMPPSTHSQNFPPMTGGFGQSFPSAGPMHQSFSVNTRERSSPPDLYGPPPPPKHEPTSFAPPSRPAYNDSFDDSPLTDSYFPPMDERPRTLSTGAGYGPPALITAPPLSQYPSQYNRRSRRSSSAAAYGPVDNYRRYDGGMHIKFRVKSSYHAGVTLGEAMANVRLSGSSNYTFRDLNTDSRGRVTLRVRWSGYRSLTYEIPVSGYDDGRTVNLQSLARRISRAIVHFLTTNAISIPWDRVVLHRLEETSFGVWMPVLTTN